MRYVRVKTQHKTAAQFVPWLNQNLTPGFHCEVTRDSMITFFETESRAIECIRKFSSFQVMELPVYLIKGNVIGKTVFIQGLD